MKKILLFLLLTPVVAIAQNMPANLTFSFPAVTLANGGTLANADAAGTFAIMRLTPSAMTVVTTGTFTVAGTGTLSGQYYGSASLNSSSFSVGTDNFAVVGYSTIGSIPTGAIIWKGRVLPGENSAGYPLIDVAKIGGATATVAAGSVIFPQGTVGTSVFASTNSVAGVVGTFGISSGTITLGTLSLGTMGVTNGISAASFSPGIATFSTHAVTGASTFAGIVNSGSTSLSGLTSTGSINIGSLNVAGIVNTGSISTGSFTAGGTSSFATITFSNVGIGTTTAASGAAWINGTLATATSITNRVNANTNQIDGASFTSHASGLIPADTRQWIGGDISVPAIGGVPDVNVIRFNGGNVGSTALPTAAAGTQGGLKILGANTGTSSQSGTETFTQGINGTVTFVTNVGTVLNGVGSVVGATGDSSGVTTLLTRLPGVATISSSGTFSIGANAIVFPTGLAASDVWSYGTRTINGASGTFNLSGFSDSGSFNIGGATTVASVNTATFTFGTLALTNASNLASLTIGTVTNGGGGGGGGDATSANQDIIINLLRSR